MNLSKEKTPQKKSHHWREVLLQGALPLSIADFASKGANVLVALLIARYFGPKIYGQYATAASVCGLFLMATGIGFEQELTRRGGINKEAISQSLILNFVAIGIMSLFAYMALVIFFSFGTYPQETIYLGILMGVALIASRFHLPFRHLCLLLNKSRITAIIQSIATVSVLLLSVCVIYFHLNIIFIIISQLLVAVCFIVVWLRWTPQEYLHGKIKKNDLKIFFKNSLPFAFSNIIWITYFNFDTFMLSLLRTEAEVGIYAGIYRIIGVNYILGYAITNAFTPKLFKVYHSSSFLFAKIGRQLVTIVFITGAILASILYFFSYIIIPFIVGESYLGGIIVSQVLSIAILFRLLNFGLCEILTTSNRQNLRVRLEAAMLFINIILNFILIPLYGGLGAATATVFAEVFLLIGCLFICYRAK
ncbi:oligosaccharide flippase family protein, partial [candidate division KSB1 bacterium]|nr:oligosaccharide flippase family protein [candidate division KSB1 bacterium]